MKVYLVKYALSSGVSLDTAYSDTASPPGYIALVAASGWFKFGRDIARTRAGAIAMVESMRTKKLASLRKQIAKLEAMDVEAMVPKEGSQ